MVNSWIFYGPVRKSSPTGGLNSVNKFIDRILFAPGNGPAFAAAAYGTGDMAEGRRSDGRRGA